MTESIEYVHIAVYFRHRIDSPGEVMLSVAERLEQEFLPSSVDVLLFASDGPGVPREWETEDGGARKLHIGFEKCSDCRVDHRTAPMLSTCTDGSLTQERPGAKRKFIDYLWHVNYDEELETPVGQDDSTMQIVFRLDNFNDRSASRDACSQLVVDCLRICCEAGQVYYGLVDVADHRETGGGSYYAQDNIEMRSSRLSRLVEKSLWRSLGRERRKFVRGVFWGNFFGDELLERLGSKERFRDRYVAHARTQIREWQSLTTEMPGGLYVRISGAPQDEAYGCGIPRVGAENAVWLHNELRAINALI